MPFSPKLKYEVGDECWLYHSMFDYKIKGQVIGVFTVEHFPNEFYIIGFMQDMYIPHFEVRDALLMSPKEDLEVPALTEKKVREKREPLFPRLSLPPSGYITYDPNDN